jgi:hypothetical protein
MTKTTSGQQDLAWFALTNMETCRLLCSSMTRRGKYHVEEHESLVNTLPEQEHQRPMTNAGTTHSEENKERRFAGEVISWLEKKVDEHNITALTLYAPPRTLGVLRLTPPGRLSGLLSEHEGNFMHLKAFQLADHPMVRELVRSLGSARRAVIEAATVMHRGPANGTGKNTFKGGV